MMPLKPHFLWLMLAGATPAVAAGISVPDAAATHAPTTAMPPAPAWQPAQTMRTTPPAGQAAAPAPVQPAAQPAQATPLPDAALRYAQEQAMPLPAADVSTLRQGLDTLQRNEGRAPVTAVPRISSLTVNLAPGASLPLVRVLPSFPATVTFTDETGSPWPIAVPPVNGNDRGFDVSWMPDAMTIQARRPYDTGTVTVYLQGLSVPVTLSMSSGEPDNESASQVTDSRLDLRIPRRGPAARALPRGRGKVALYDGTLQAFLDGVPPAEARRLKTQGAVPDTAVWQIGDDLFIRGRHDIRDAFDQTLASADGTRVWKLPVTPEVSFSVQGHTQILSVSLE